MEFDGTTGSLPRWDEPHMAGVTAGLTRLSNCLRAVSVSAQHAATAFGSLGYVLWRQDLAVRPGVWPDYFALLNRYVRTGVEPPNPFVRKA